MRLTDRQSAVLAYIRDYISEHEYPPIIREIGAHFGIGVNGVVGHLRALEQKGFIERLPNSPRAIRVVNTAESTPPKPAAV